MHRNLMAVKSLWTCPKCGRQFTNRNQSHSCGRYTVEDFLKGKPSGAEWEHEGSQDHCRNRRLESHSRSLLSQGRLLCFVLNRLDTAVHVARAARSKRHSGFVAGLKDARRANIERHKQRQSPPTVRAKQDHCDRQRKAGQDADDADGHALLALFRANIDEAHLV